MAPQMRYALFPEPQTPHPYPPRTLALAGQRDFTAEGRGGASARYCHGDGKPVVAAAGTAGRRRLPVGRVGEAARPGRPEREGARRRPVAAVSRLGPGPAGAGSAPSVSSLLLPPASRGPSARSARPRLRPPPPPPAQPLAVTVGSGPRAPPAGSSRQPRGSVRGPRPARRRRAKFTSGLWGSSRCWLKFVLAPPQAPPQNLQFIMELLYWLWKEEILKIGRFSYRSLKFPVVCSF
ncbi:atherin-like [Equus quagga]|uniref:atherin-like n=1 Tax=Equus quagga TaxID=89248 RepID=UPI001EE3106F|nr:atherin-like [Equus quagga]